ncbi:MAG: hypothetical protein ACK53Y_13525, partial [bacterium]
SDALLTAKKTKFCGQLSRCKPITCHSNHGLPMTFSQAIPVLTMSRSCINMNSEAIEMLSGRATDKFCIKIRN